MRLTCLQLVFSLLVLMWIPAHAGSTPKTKIFLRVHVQTNAAGLPNTQVASVAVPPDNEVIQIRALPELTEQNLIDVQSTATGGVRLMFNHTGQVNLDAVTAENDGRILVVMLNGYVLYAPIIDQRITTGELDIPHPLSPQVLQLLQETAQNNVLQASKR